MTQGSGQLERLWLVNGTTIRVVFMIGIAFLSAAESAAEESCCSDCVVVEVDLDPAQPGIQTQLVVGEGTRWVRDVSIWVRDPTHSAKIHSIGFLGGLNRGLAFGHAPSAQNEGEVEGIEVTSTTPVVPGHDVTINSGIEPLFDGPEIQYFEFADFGEEPGDVPTTPSAPIVALDIELLGASQGDVYRFYLGDKTAEWIRGQGGSAGGAFSTADLNTLESGGDACPDGTLTSAGIDSDVPAPVPPGMFLVDYRDGGGAEIRVVTGVPALGHRGRAIIGALLAISTWLAASRRTPRA